MRFLIVAVLCCVASTAFADWYVVDKDNNVVSRCSYQPDQKDLDSRQEIAVISSSDIPLSQAEYRNGKIIEHKKTAKEIADEAIEVEKANELRMIEHRARDMAIEKLESEGVQIKYKEEYHG